MKNRKIGLILAIVFIIPIFLIAFRKDGNKKNNKIEIVTSCYPVCNLTEKLLSGIDDFSVSNLTSNYLQSHSCLHDYSLTTDNARKLEEASILVVNGVGFETFVAGISNKNLSIIEASKKVDVQDGNPFVWMSISNYIKQLTFLSEEFSKFFARYKDDINNNFKKYKENLQKVLDNWSNKLSQFKGQEIAVTSDKFDYFLKDFELVPFKLVNGHSHENNLSSEDISKAVTKIKSNSITFFISEKNDQKYETIEQESGCKALLLDTLDYPNERDYVDRINENLNIIYEAL